jgi:hypothetical protein
MIKQGLDRNITVILVSKDMNHITSNYLDNNYVQLFNK